MILFFDTETTGLPDFKARSTDPKQPHLVQLALILCDDVGAEISAECVLVRPDGWEISEELTAIHGISHADALARGISETEAVDMFLLAQARARLRVAHNESFDRRILRIALTRAEIARDMIEAIEARPFACTCNRATPIVNLPPSSAMVAAGMSHPKSAKLTECMNFFFQETLEGAHDALIDARACARVWFKLEQMGKAA